MANTLTAPTRGRTNKGSVTHEILPPVQGAQAGQRQPQRSTPTAVNATSTPAVPNYNAIIRACSVKDDGSLSVRFRAACDVTRSQLGLAKSQTLPAEHIRALREAEREVMLSCLAEHNGRLIAHNYRTKLVRGHGEVKVGSVMDTVNTSSGNEKLPSEQVKWLMGEAHELCHDANDRIKGLAGVKTRADRMISLEKVSKLISRARRNQNAAILIGTHYNVEVKPIELPEVPTSVE
jgi:hypothetical protein